MRRADLQNAIGGPSGERQSPFSLQHPIQCVSTFGLGRPDSRIAHAGKCKQRSSAFRSARSKKTGRITSAVIFSIKRVQDLGQFKRSVGIRNKNDNSRAMSQGQISAERRSDP